MVLGNGGQALIKKKFNTIMVSSYQKMAPSQVWLPMADGEDEADEFSFICY